VNYNCSTRTHLINTWSAAEDVLSRKDRPSNLRRKNATRTALQGNPVSSFRIYEMASKKILSVKASKKILSVK
jgi:hypothetical protein